MAKPSIGAVCTAALFSSTAVLAQQRPAQNAENTETLNTVIVTGSRIVHTDTDTPSPVQVISAADLQQSGYTNTQEVLKNLTANGQGTLSQSFSGAFASGAAGIALRGLNVGYTLVLIDGHRSAPYPIGDDGQRSFVDVADIPFDSIERIEVLKDGASAVYGSDAIAGVVNIILKKSFTGLTATADAGTSSHADGTTEHASATWGIGDLANDGHNFYIAGEFRHQQQIRFSDRGGIFENKDFTGTGGYNLNFGVPNPRNGGFPRSATGYIVDETKGTIAGFMPGCNQTSFDAGQCAFNDSWNQIQPSTKNYNIVSKFTQNFADNWKLTLSGTYFQSQSVQTNNPSQAFFGGYQGVTLGPGLPPSQLDALGPTTIPSTNPSFPKGTGLSEAYLYYTFLDLGGTQTHTDAKTYRAVADLDGKVGSWNLEASAGYTEVTLHEDNRGFVQAALLQAALNSTTAPYLVGQHNTAAVLNSIAPAQDANDSSKLFFVHAGATAPIVDLSGGPLAIAFGSDWYERKQFAAAPTDTQHGLTGSGYASPSNNFTVGTQNVAAAYAELDAPVLKTLDIDAAIRYDHYNLSGGQASPKIGFKFQPIDEFGIRGTASKGFRAPGPAENSQAGQTFFAGASADPILCPNSATPTAAGNFAGQCSVQVPGLQSTNPHLKPETSKAFTFGFVGQPFPDLKATVDLYSIQINNQIVAGGPSTTVRGNNLSPIPKYQADGTTVLTVPPAPPILYFTTSYINANTTKTDGVDLAIDYHHRFDSGWQYSSNASYTYLHSYKLTINGVVYELAGTHGPAFFSGDTGNPKSKAQWSNTIGRENWSITGTMNYISAFSVTDPSLVAFQPTSPAGTCLQALTNEGGAAGADYQAILANGVIPPQTSCSVKHFTTFDLYGSYDLSKNFNLHASVTNVFNTKAPLDWATYGGALGLVPWNPSLHLQGAIGTFFTLGATYKF